MSYILDALRKSDLQRQRAITPTLRTAPATEVLATQSALMAYGVLAAILLSAGMAIGWLRPWQAAKPVAAQAVMDTEIVAAKARVPASRPRAMLPPPPAAPLVKAEAAKPPQKIVFAEQPLPTKVVIVETRQVEKIAPRRGEVPPLKARAKPPAEKPATAVAQADEPDARVRNLAELPASVRQELPKMDISGHVYSDAPEGRMVGINDRLMREGESPAPGLVLEKITPEGMVFRYGKYRFHSDVQ